MPDRGDHAVAVDDQLGIPAVVTAGELDGFAPRSAGDGAAGDQAPPVGAEVLLPRYVWVLEVGFFDSDSTEPMILGEVVLDSTSDGSKALLAFRLPGILSIRQLNGRQQSHYVDDKLRGQFALKNFHSSHLGRHPQKAAGD